MLWAVVCLSVTLAVAAAGSESIVCTPPNYRRSFDACLNGRRNIINVKQLDAVCDGPDVIPDVATSHLPVLGACDAATNQQTVIHYTASTSCTGTPVDTVLLNGTTTCACTPANIKTAFTPCVNGSRFVVSYWGRQCTVWGDGPQLPPLQKVACFPQCSSGEFLNSDVPYCSQCPAGTYSFNGESLSQPYKVLPRSLSSLCRDSTGASCDGWQPCGDGSCINSGDLVRFNSVVSSVRLAVRVLTLPATVSFKYKLSTEYNADIFTFTLNGRTVIVTSGDVAWTAVDFDLLEIAPFSEYPCFWKYGGVCIFENQLTPFSEANWFPFGETTLVTTRLLGTPCDIHTFIASTRGEGVMVGKGNCSLDLQISNARSAGVSTLLLIDDDETLTTLGGSAAFRANTLRGNCSALSQGTFRVGTISSRGADMLAVGNAQKVTATVTYDATPTVPVELTWTYQKDISLSRGEDTVYLRDIVVTGTKLAEDACKACPPGTGSKDGAAECLSCPANTYSNEAGTAYPCRSCPERQTSGVGSTSCTLASACDIADYEPVHNGCQWANNEFRELLSFALIQPSECDVTKSAFVSPAPQYVPCRECGAGSYREPTGACSKLCKDGQRADKLTGACVPCDAGTYAQKVTAYNGFSSFNHTFPRSWGVASDHCGGAAGGWGFTRSYPGQGAYGEMLLGMQSLTGGCVAHMFAQFNLTLEGIVTMQYGIIAPYDAMGTTPTITFSIYRGLLRTRDASNMLVEEVIAVPTRSDGTSTALYQSPPLRKGPVTLWWRYARDTFPQQRPVRIVIKQLSVTESTTGGSDACIPCPSGYECHGNELPVSCPLGTFSNTTGSSKCLSCPPDKVATANGTSLCASCPKGMIPGGGQGLCVLPQCIYDSHPESHPNASVDDYLALFMNPSTIRSGHVPLGGVAQRVYDLQALQRATIKAEVSGTVTRTSLEYSLCASVDFESMPAFGIATSLIRGGLESQKQRFSLGNQLSVSELLASGTDESLGLRINITAQECPENARLPLTSMLTLTCDTETESVVILSAERAAMCIFDIKLKTRLACPLCTNQSFAYVDTECNAAGMKQRHFYFSDKEGLQVPRQACIEKNIRRPATTSISCPFTLDFNHGFTRAWAIVIGVVVIVAALVGVSGYLFYTRRKLYVAYERLATSVGTELGDTVRLENEGHTVDIGRRENEHEHEHQMGSSPPPLGCTAPQHTATPTLPPSPLVPPPPDPQQPALVPPPPESQQPEHAAA